MGQGIEVELLEAEAAEESLRAETSDSRFVGLDPTAASIKSSVLSQFVVCAEELGEAEDKLRVAGKSVLLEGV